MTCLDFIVVAHPVFFVVFWFSLLLFFLPFYDGFLKKKTLSNTLGGLLFVGFVVTGRVFIVVGVFLLWLLFSHVYLGFHTEIYFPTCCWAPVVHGPSVNVPAARMNHPPLGMLLVSDLDCSYDFVFVFVLNVVFVDQN